jgi:selenium metabolism protein YedF
MNTEQLDCRGLACPSPVLKTKEVIDRGNIQQLKVLVDNAAASENVSRFLTRFCYQVMVNQQEGAFAVAGQRKAVETQCEPVLGTPHSDQRHKIRVLSGTECLGRGDDELDRKLVGNFLATLPEMGQDLWRLVLVNGGVKLAIDGSGALGALQELEQDGVQVLVCGTCLNHFDILEQKHVGETTNMLDIVTAMQLANKVISLT